MSPMEICSEQAPNSNTFKPRYEIALSVNMHCVPRRHSYSNHVTVHVCSNLPCAAIDHMFTKLNSVSFSAAGLPVFPLTAPSSAL